MLRADALRRATVAIARVGRFVCLIYQTFGTTVRIIENKSMDIVTMFMFFFVFYLLKNIYSIKW